VTRGQLPQRAGLPGLNGGGALFKIFAVKYYLGHGFDLSGHQS